LGQPDCDEVAARFGQTAFANDGKTLTKIRLLLHKKIGWGRWLFWISAGRETIVALARVVL
jgi:hypothetical protein